MDLIRVRVGRLANPGARANREAAVPDRWTTSGAGHMAMSVSKMPIRIKVPPALRYLYCYRMKTPSIFIGLLFFLQSMLCIADSPKVVAVKIYTGFYPASHSLLIPFHGCVELDGPLPEGGGEYWLSLEHLMADADFTKIEILVNSARTILGARATFKGSVEEWEGGRGYESRKRVLFAFMGGDGPELSKELPLAYDGGEFGSMVYTFDRSGHVSWRKPQGYVPVTEARYVESQEKHKRECNEDGCRNLNTVARVILPDEKQSGQTGAGQPTTRSDPASERGNKTQSESEECP